MSMYFLAHRILSGHRYKRKGHGMGPSRQWERSHGEGRSLLPRALHSLVPEVFATHRYYVFFKYIGHRAHF